MKKSLFIFYILLNFCAIAQQTTIKGISFVASRDSISEKHVTPLVQLNANYAAVIPFGFIERLDHPEILYNTDRQWYGETIEGTKQYIFKLQQNNINVMLKPQIWVWNGEFTGHLSMTTEEDWKLLEASYRNFILDFARLAKETNVPLLCIGTELELFIKHRPAYWTQLISEIKQVYSGKLTYAANWDEYARVPFWNQLDFIGVDAYFPISEKETPTLQEAKYGWSTWKNELKTVSRKHNKKILFTEYGYRNTDFAGKEPWHSGRERKTVNHDNQGTLLVALFEEVWQEPWMAGGFLWKWFIDHDNSGGGLNNQFTVQNKPSQLVVQYYYAIDE
ncbi:glycoside hydrolase family 113 [Marixanthomonas spongiae]|uniref:Glycoside hydrolase n=1 Tax=Marixanthomonas spongiae TaxID=2174845 RepID=A0A2U0I8H6_9FLAO|nr:glycoside hydrolase [Marixanthomonas spongiae]PVW17374.1 glycoside hydrolase [Marixanthomonas spongiae]